MLAGLSALELGRLRMSVGYGTHKKGRPLSPIEVGTLLRNARNSGVSLKECADKINLDETGIRVTQVIATVTQDTHAAIRKFAHEENTNQDEAVVMLIEDALIGRGLLEQ